MPMPDPEYSKRLALWHARSLPAAFFPASITVGEPEPVYDEAGALVWYEVPYLRPTFTGAALHAGYALVCIDPQEDFPIAEFTTSSLPNHVQARQRLGDAPFRLHRYGPGYFVAEAADGTPLDEIGTRPRLVSTDVRQHKHRVEGRSSEAGVMIEVLQGDKPPLPSDPIGHAIPSYSDFKATFRRPKPKLAGLASAWQGAPSRDGPDVPQDEASCRYDVRKVDHYRDRPRYRQIPAHEAPNTTGHASGCGPTAWLDLIGYHDAFRTQGLLPGQHPWSDAATDALTMRLHDHLGTSGVFGQGFTWPSDMFKGYDFVRTELGHYAEGAGRQDWFDTDEDWVYEIARASMDAGLPFIVGYYQDWHYTLGLGTAECTTHGWRKHAWILVEFGVAKWIPKGTIFAAYAVSRFAPIHTKGYLTDTAGVTTVVHGPGEAAALTVYAGTYRLEKPAVMKLDWQREVVTVELSSFEWPAGAILQTSATAWLAAVGEKDAGTLPDNLGFAVDAARVVRDDETRRLRMELDVALRGASVELLRVAYKVHVVSKAV